MSFGLPRLPVSEVLDDVAAALHQHCKAVLVAPPGAGKTTLVPLHLMQQDGATGRILLLEPRRLAARAAARRMAQIMGEDMGASVGYAMRMDRKESAATRVLVVTEGLLARLILDDPELTGISTIIFDEFHERSLDGDFGLALALDVQAALRPDLRLLVMSATIDGARVASLLGDAPVIRSEGRSYPVDVRYRERSADRQIEDAVADAIRAAVSEEPGSILAFLPGQREIERTAERLEGRLPSDCTVFRLFGAMEAKDQDEAIRAVDKGRKIVLATSIAETSITIDGVRIVIDSGLSRLPRYEPATGLTRLETVRGSRASADQRAGRAGRTEPGIAIRLWRAEQTAALPAFTPAEILDADLSGLILDCASFGVADPAALAFLDPPPKPAMAEARNLLQSLGAIDADGRITKSGERMRRLSLPVRLAHMVAEAKDARQAARLAVLLTERGLGGTGIDVEERLSRFARDGSPRARSARALADRLVRGNAGGGDEVSVGSLLLLAYPDRVAKARGADGHFVLANGRGAFLDAGDRLARSHFLVVADLQGRAQNARIAAAAQVSEDEIRALLAARIERGRSVQFDAERQSVRVSERERLGAIVLSERQLPAPKGEASDRAILQAVRELGPSILPWDRGTETLRSRLGWLHRGLGEPWPDVSDSALVERLEDWLLPFLRGEPNLSRPGALSLHDGLMSLVPYDRHHLLDTLAPTHFDVPSGSRLPIRYDSEAPVLAVRVQELFGLGTHPSIAGGIVPLTLELLSPAHRPVQTTRDLPRFWSGSWADVRADMRGRYPKHHWPENPLEAQATNRAKPRKVR